MVPKVCLICLCFCCQGCEPLNKQRIVSVVPLSWATQGVGAYDDTRALLAVKVALVKGVAECKAAAEGASTMMMHR